MAGTPIAIGDQFLVNTTTQGFQVVSDIAVLPGIGFVIVWTDQSQTGGDTSGHAVRAQLFDADGVKIGSEILVNTSTSGNQLGAKATALADGGFVVVWYDAEGEVFAQAFDDDGVKQGEEIPVSANPPPSLLFSIDVVATSDGGFTVMWMPDVTRFLQAQHFDAAGSPTGPAIGVSEATDAWQASAANADGMTLVAWRKGGGLQGGESIQAQLLDGAGQKIGANFAISQTDGLFQSTPSISTLSDGGFIAVWQHLNTAPEPDVWSIEARIVYADGTLSPQFQVAESSGVLQHAAATSTADGGFVIAWMTPSALSMQRYDADGDKVGEAITVMGPVAGEELFPELATLDNGDLVLTWTYDPFGTIADDSDYSVRAQLFSLPPVLLGTSGDDMIAGATAEDWIKGKAGDDVLSGGLGSDVLLGGDGNDVLTPGAGADQTFGEAGDDIVFLTDSDGIVFGGDVLDGGAGVDALGIVGDVVLDPGQTPSLVSIEQIIFSDAPLGAQSFRFGGDFLTTQLPPNVAVISLNTASVALYVYAPNSAGVIDLSGWTFENWNNGSVFLDGSDAADSIFGSVENDSINGFGGDDLIAGGAGHDFIDGGFGEGADRIDGGDGGDVLFGGGGDDILIGGAGEDRLDGDFGNDTANYSNDPGAVSVDLSMEWARDGWNTEDRLTFIENIVGSAFSDVLIGNAGANVLQGGAGDDNLSGGAGNDTLDGGAGLDTVWYADAPSAVAVTLATQGVAQDTGGGGTDTLSGVEQVQGSDFDDVLTGSSANDVLIGRDGNDRLSGGAGADWIVGGAGNDRFIQGTDEGGVDQLFGDAGADTIDYSAATGGVIVQLSGYATTGAGALLATFSGIEYAVGSSFDDALIGTAGGNRFVGGAGADWIVGGAGNDHFTQGLDAGVDQLFGDSGIDTISYAAATGGVIVQLSGYSTTSAGSLLAVFSGIENAVGGSGADALIGDGADNALTGRAGADWLVGGGGADRFIYQGINEGGDTIADFSRGEGDLIDLSAIDANAAMAGDQAFSFSTTRTSGLAGQVVASNSAEFSTIRIYLDGDDVADMVLHVAHQPGLAMNAGDFVL